MLKRLFANVKTGLKNNDITDVRKNLILLKACYKKIELMRTSLLIKPLNWLTVGPFAGMQRKDLARTNPPENDLFLANPKIPESYELDGVTFPVLRKQQGYIAMDKIERDAVPLDDVGTYYIFTRIYSDKERDVTLLLGLDDWSIITHNGKQIYKFDGRSQGAFYGQYKVQVKLNEGLNYFSLKLINGGGPGGFNFDLIDSLGHWPKGVLGL
jgi:hypothetical protein